MQHNHTSTIYITGTVNGTLLFGGIWTMKREAGFPVDLAVMEIHERKGLPDYAEMLADAGSVSLPAWEFDTAIKELHTVAPGASAMIMSQFASWFDTQSNGDPFHKVCQRLLAQKRKKCVMANQ